MCLSISDCRPGVEVLSSEVSVVVAVVIEGAVFLEQEVCRWSELRILVCGGAEVVRCALGRGWNPIRAAVCWHRRLGRKQTLAQGSSVTQSS